MRRVREVNLTSGRLPRITAPSNSEFTRHTIAHSSSCLVDLAVQVALTTPNPRSSRAAPDLASHTDLLREIHTDLHRGNGPPSSKQETSKPKGVKVTQRVHACLPLVDLELVHLVRSVVMPFARLVDNRSRPFKNNFKTIPNSVSTRSDRVSTSSATLPKGAIHERH